MKQLSTANETIRRDYAGLFQDILDRADLQTNFDEEILTLNGKTFRSLMEQTGKIVTQNYMVLQRECELKWNYHSAFFFAGTVGWV